LISIQQSQESTTRWKEAVFSSKSGPEFELQEVIEKNPDLIPWEILGLSSPLKVLGREVATVDGKMIDHLAIDSQGHVYIFECKMAKNHELRSVIAQALEYAAQLSSLTTLDELLTAVKKTPQEVVEVFEDTEGSQVTQGLGRAVRKADYRIIIVTDYAGNSSQARVNRKTIEYLRSTLEIHLVEIAKFENQVNEKLFVPHITAGGAAIPRTIRQLEVWEKNLFNSLSGNPALSAALMEYLSWVKDTNPEGTKITPGGILSSPIPNLLRYIAYIEPLDKGSSYRIWVQTTLPEGLSEIQLTEWRSTLDSYSQKLGESAGSNYYLLNAETEPHVIESHLELQQKLLELAQSAKSIDATPDCPPYSLRHW